MDTKVDDDLGREDLAARVSWQLREAALRECHSRGLDNPESLAQVLGIFPEGALRLLRNRTWSIETGLRVLSALEVDVQVATALDFASADALLDSVRPGIARIDSNAHPLNGSSAHVQGLRDGPKERLDKARLREDASTSTEKYPIGSFDEPEEVPVVVVDGGAKTGHLMGVGRVGLGPLEVDLFIDGVGHVRVDLPADGLEEMI